MLSFGIYDWMVVILFKYWYESQYPWLNFMFSVAYQWYYIKLNYPMLQTRKVLINRLVCQGLFYKHLCYSLIDYFCFFEKISLKSPNSQTVRARYLTFWENVHHPPYVASQLSTVQCQVSHIRSLQFWPVQWKALVRAFLFLNVLFKFQYY